MFFANCSNDISEYVNPMDKIRKIEDFIQSEIESITMYASLKFTIEPSISTQKNMIAENQPYLNLLHKLKELIEQNK